MNQASGYLEAQQREQRMNQADILRKQIADRENAKKQEKDFYSMKDHESAQRHLNANAALNQEQAHLKAERMRHYKDSLDNQINQRNKFAQYGNMSQVEKQMNKEDLQAWKRYDNHQYSLIPGFSTNKTL